MYDDLVKEFQTKLSHVTDGSEPTTSEELATRLAEISEAMQLCERALLYAATSVEHHEDVITHLFEYKQLLRLERHLVKLKPLLPSGIKPVEPQHPKKWWQFA